MAADAGTAAIAGATLLKASRMLGSKSTDIGKIGRSERLQSGGGGLTCFHWHLYYLLLSGR